MPSIVNPYSEPNGAAAVTRGLLKALTCFPLDAQVDCIPARTTPFRWHRLGQARSLILGSISSLPAKAAFLYSKDFRDRVAAQARRQRYDLAVLNGADLLWITDYLPASIPRILIAHNIEHRLFRTQVNNLSWVFRPLRRMLLKDCTRLREYERDGMRKIGSVIFLSAEEAAYAASLCEGLRSTVIPPVFDYEPWTQPRASAGPTLEIGFLGNLRWWPNELGLRWFVDEVLPYVKAPVRINLFGSSGGRSLRNDGRIVEHGVVERIEQVWANCDLLICPAFATGGVCVKLAEAVYNRMPVLATRQAVRGFMLDADPALVLLDEPGEWIEFLNSQAAIEVAERRISQETSAVFAMATHKDRLQQFVQATLSSGGAREAGA